MNAVTTGQDVASYLGVGWDDFSAETSDQSSGHSPRVFLMISSATDLGTSA